MKRLSARFSFLGLILMAGFGAIMLLTGAANQDRGIAGRYQLVSDHNTTIFLVDSTTGRVWRFSKLMNSDNKSISPCRGMETCFLEVDRAKLKGAMYVSEPSVVGKEEE